MKTVTLTFNEALVLIAEGMTMNNVKSLANKLRNADAPVAATQQSLKLANTQVYDLERALEKAKQTETTLRAEISNLESRLNKANGTLDKVKGLYDDGEGFASREVLMEIRRVVEAYYCGN